MHALNLKQSAQGYERIIGEILRISCYFSKTNCQLPNYECDEIFE